MTPDSSAFWLQLATIIVGALVSIIGGWLTLKVKTAADDAKAAKLAAEKNIEATSTVAKKTDALEIKVDGRLTQLLAAMEAKAVAEKSEAALVGHTQGVAEQKEKERLRAEGAASEKDKAP